MSRLAFHLRVVISVALVVLLLKLADLRAMAALLGSANAVFAALVVVLAFADRVFMAFKWNLLVHGLGVRLPFRRALRVYLVSSFAGMFLPVSVGADVIRLCTVDVDSHDRERIAASIVIERVLAFLSLLVLVFAAGVALMLRAYPGARALAATAALLLAAGGAFFVVSLSGIPVRLRARLNGPLLGRLARFADAYRAYAGRHGLLAAYAGLSFVEQLLPVLCNYFVARALGLPVSLPAFLVITPVTLLLARMPVSLDGIGVQEAMYWKLLQMAGVSGEAALSLGILARFLTVLALLPGGVLLALAPPRRAAPEVAAAPPRGPRVGLALLVTFAVWFAFTWPLPRHLIDGIPSSGMNCEKFQTRAMIPGDHLQLLYHFWLAGDMVRGHTPLFYNLYEFNTGDDAERREVGGYFIPFSLVYAFGDWVGGQELGWNFAGFVSIFVTYLGTWLLVRRFVRDPWLAAAAATVSILLPYRWLTLLGGSPTGFALGLVPWLALGLDMAVHDERARGGVLAGAVVVLCYFADVQAFFFCVVSMPGWCLLAFLRREEPFAWGSVRAYGRLALALLPAGLATAAAYLLTRIDAARLANSALSKGWRDLDALLYSPGLASLFQWTRVPLDNYINIGVVLALLLAAGATALVVQRLRRSGAGRREALVALLVFAAVALVVLLALGVRGPGEGLVYRALRRLLSPYRMVRQTAKIYCLMPTLLSLAAGLSCAALFGGLRARWRIAAATLVLALVFAEFRSRIRTTVCTVDDRQGAYEAVANDAQADGIRPHILILPLWPGDSHWGSVYEHYVSLYRIRMVNGYRPAVSSAYIENIFKRFEILNSGGVPDDLLDDLLARGVRYLLVQEDAFPEKVSPFPVSFTLDRLLSHPRLRLLAQDQRVWAFKIGAAAAADRGPLAGAGATTSRWPYRFPARRWEFERIQVPRHTLADVARAAFTNQVEDAAASGGRYVTVVPSDGLALVMPPSRLPAAEDMRWMVRGRGHGVVQWHTGVGGGTGAAARVRFDTDRWVWRSVPLSPTGAVFQTGLAVQAEEGRLELDTCLLAAGPWPGLEAGDSLEIPAPCFFHAGYTDRTTGRVVLLSGRDSDGAIFYGPCLPLDPGEYAVELGLRVTSPVGGDGRLGTLRVLRGGTLAGEMAVTADRPAIVRFRHTENTPVRIEFMYTRRANLELGPVTLRREK